MNHLIGEDIKILRRRYDEALKLRGVPAKYQYPSRATSNTQGETVVDTYSIPEDTHVFFEGNPKVKTLKRYGWVVENNDDLPFLIHCSFHLEHLQKDSLFQFSGLYSELPDRIFRVTEISYDLEAPDHLVCKCIPVYDKQNVTGRTDREIRNQFSKSNYFIKQNVDYRGDYQSEKEGDS